jgi:hypothetical protein
MIARGPEKIIVAAGAYTDIISITAPSTALPGETVQITVRIKNTYSSPIGIMVGGALEYGVTPWPTINYPTNWANVDAGQTKSFTGSFTMPSSAVTIHAYSYYYGADSAWHFDDELTKSVGLAEGSDWVQLASTNLSISPLQETGAWVQLQSVNLVVGVMEETGEWVMLQSTTLSLGVITESEEWVELQSADLSLDVITEPEAWVELGGAEISIQIRAGEFSNLAVTYEKA